MKHILLIIILPILFIIIYYIALYMATPYDKNDKWTEQIKSVNIQHLDEKAFIYYLETVHKYNKGNMRNRVSRTTRMRNTERYEIFQTEIIYDIYDKDGKLVIVIPEDAIIEWAYDLSEEERDSLYIFLIIPKADQNPQTISDYKAGWDYEKNK